MTAHDRNLIGVVFDDEQYWRVDATHTAIQSIETEAVILRAVQQTPRTALCTRRQVKAQLLVQTNKQTLSWSVVTTKPNITGRST